MAGGPSGGLLAPPRQPGGLFAPPQRRGGLLAGSGASGSWAPEPTFWEKLQKGMRDAVALPGTVLDKPSEGVKRHFGYKQKLFEAEHYAAAFAIPKNRGPTSPQNAFVHAYVSATLAYHWNQNVARRLGNVREVSSTVSHDIPEFLSRGGDLATLGRRVRDTIRDRYNNEIGFQIGEFAKANGLRYVDIPYLVKDALSRGLLITDEMSDSRNGLLWPSAPQQWEPSDEMALQRRL